MKKDSNQQHQQFIKLAVRFILSQSFAAKAAEAKSKGSGKIPKGAASRIRELQQQRKKPT